MVCLVIEETFHALNEAWLVTETDRVLTEYRSVLIITPTREIIVRIFAFMAVDLFSSIPNDDEKPLSSNL
jgi:hypothetical protein